MCRKQTCFSLMIIIFAGLSNLGCGLSEFISKHREETIKNTPELKELDDFCRQIPLPPNFQFIERGSLDDQRIVLHFEFFSNTKYADSRKVFDKYFESENWQLTKQDNSYPKTVEFRNDKYSIEIAHGNFGKANYAITCEKLTRYSK